jgi:hypothetical protein
VLKILASVTETRLWPSKGAKILRQPRE